MRSDPEVYRLKFQLPAGAAADPPGSVAADPECALIVSHAGHITIEAPARERAFALAGRFLRLACRSSQLPLSIAATLESPGRDRFGRPTSPRDSWSIIVGADVAFSPTSMPPEFVPARRADRRPLLNPVQW